MRGVHRCTMKLAHLLLAAAMLAASAAGADDLTGLWKAKRNFGPDARGTLVMRKTAAGWTADLAGYAVPARADRTRLSFALPGGAGSFSGRVSGETIRGHWVTPNSMVNGSKYAVPVTLTRDGTSRWRGTVTPRDDTFTLYLVIDGDKAFLRNPERNFGVQANVERIVVDGNNVRLVGKRNGRGEEQDLATGTYRPDDKVLTLWIRGGSYDFRRDSGENGFYARGKTPERYSYRPPLARDDGWPVATLSEENISRDGIEKLVQSILDTPIDSVHAPIVESVLIARHGPLVLEDYFHGEHRDKLHESRSAGKSMTAMFAGAVMQAGAPPSLAAPGCLGSKDLAPRKARRGEEHDRDVRRRRDAGGRAAAAVGAGLSGAQGPRSAQARHDARAPPHDARRLFLRRQQSRRAGQRGDDSRAGERARLLPLLARRAASNGTGHADGLLQHDGEPRARRDRPRRRGRSARCLRPPARASVEDLDVRLAARSRRQPVRRRRRAVPAARLPQVRPALGERRHVVRPAHPRPRLRPPRRVAAARLQRHPVRVSLVEHRVSVQGPHRARGLRVRQRRADRNGHPRPRPRRGDLRRQLRGSSSRRARPAGTRPRLHPSLGRRDGAGVRARFPITVRAALTTAPPSDPRARPAPG